MAVVTGAVQAIQKLAQAIAIEYTGRTDHGCAFCCRATGETTSQREALVRQIRGLQGTPWKQEVAHFEAYAAALLQLLALYTSAAEAGQPSVRCAQPPRDDMQ
jgi:hypothetical protein